MAKLYQKAIDPKTSINEEKYGESLDIICNTDIWGYREILSVVVVAMLLDKTFKASTDLYSCNPRGIYEGPIKEFFIEKNIPHRKSGPLNIAKATKGLNMIWAAQRRRKEAAEKIVDLVNSLEADYSLVENVGVSLMKRLLEASSAMAILKVDIKPMEDPDYLYYLCHELIIREPDAGNTPQKIAAFLLQCYHNSFNTCVEVTGGEDRASVTSTTSKKPGDINEEVGNSIYKVYEITVKSFDLPRIRDSYDCISAYNAENETRIKEIIVICREEDCPEGIEKSGLYGYLGKYVYQDIVYYYWDIFEWISNLLQHMTAHGRNLFYQKLNKYIDELNTSISVKILWQQLHSTNN